MEGEGVAPSSGKAPSRSRAACTACRATKQRCDGPSRNPCRRCELYGLACEYTAAPATQKPTKLAHANQASTSSAPGSFLPPVASGSNGVYRAPADGEMAERLREISERLGSIERSLKGVHLTPGSHISTTATPPSSLSHAASPQESQHAATQMAARQGQKAKAGSTSAMGSSFGSTPIDAVADTISKVVPMADGEEREALNKGTPLEYVQLGYPSMPDCIVRGIMTLDQCNLAFRFFAQYIQVWCGLIEAKDATNCLAVRERSPFLFHVILLTASYYTMNTQSCLPQRRTYNLLLSLVNELLGPQVLSPQSYNVNLDLVRALVLLILYKPVQFASLHANGISDPTLAEQRSKVNASASAFVQGLANRTAYHLKLYEAPDRFARAAASAPGGANVTDDIANDLRAWYVLCIIDVQGSIQGGRLPLVDITDALKITRLFASLRKKPTDVRMSAWTELSAIGKNAISFMPPAAAGRKAQDEHLKKANSELDAWETFWFPLLDSAAMESGDPLGRAGLLPFVNFTRTVLNGFVFSRWLAERSADLEQGGTGRPELSNDDWENLERIMGAAEVMIFALSTESKTEIRGRRDVNWPVDDQGRDNRMNRPSLTLDMEVVETHRYAMDTLIVVVYFYVMSCLAKMANECLIVCDLVTLRDSYENGSGPLHQPLRPKAKIARLLKLCAEFLDAAAPTPFHPAKRQAIVLRTMLRTGLVMPIPESANGTTPSSSGGDVPVLGPPATVPAGIAQTSSNFIYDGTSFSFPTTLPSDGNDINWSYGSSETQQKGEKPVPTEPAEALQSLLGGFDPSFFRDIAWPSTSTASSSQHGAGDMQVDWNTLAQWDVPPQPF